MANQKTITAQVLEALQRNPSCEFDTLAADCSEFTWNQLFYEVDRLSRLGRLLLTPVGDGHYFLRLPQKQKEESHETKTVSVTSPASVAVLPERSAEPGPV